MNQMEHWVFTRGEWSADTDFDESDFTGEKTLEWLLNRNGYSWRCAPFEPLTALPDNPDFMQIEFFSSCGEDECAFRFPLLCLVTLSMTWIATIRITDVPSYFMLQPMFHAWRTVTLENDADIHEAEDRANRAGNPHYDEDIANVAKKLRTRLDEIRAFKTKEAST